ncbi:MAG TPA: hypothetical protein VE954_10090 [Oligoflexus sp.]|nr:hypothetical protein [Oligoflexus sp.]HYX33452.1 hypothetical protein [Oligoflexus sp.]
MERISESWKLVQAHAFINADQFTKSEWIPDIFPLQRLTRDDDMIHPTIQARIFANWRQIGAIHTLGASFFIGADVEFLAALMSKHVEPIG